MRQRYPYNKLRKNLSIIGTISPAVTGLSLTEPWMINLRKGPNNTSFATASRTRLACNVTFPTHELMSNEKLLRIKTHPNQVAEACTKGQQE